MNSTTPSSSAPAVAGQQDAKASPHVVDGKIEGFVLTSIRPGSVYEEAGLREGDVIRSVNGRRSTGMAEVLAALESARDEKVVELEVQRAGKTFVVRLPSGRQ